ncbi:MAG: type II toxin-antitoxin system MqsA family antitoxin [Desulfuromonadales bacterium]
MSGKTICPVCGVCALTHEVRDLPYTYKGRKTIIESVKADWCEACGESLTGPGDTDRVMAAMRAFQRIVNADMVSPDFVRTVRGNLGLDQREAAMIFGGGVNAFSRYETGKTRPPVAMVKLLKLLDRHPELFNEVR